MLKKIHNTKAMVEANNKLSLSMRSALKWTRSRQNAKTKLFCLKAKV